MILDATREEEIKSVAFISQLFLRIGIVNFFASTFLFQVRGSGKYSLVFTYAHYNLWTAYSGYMAPEYLERGRAGRKCDIYSFGVIILAIVMGDGPRYMRDPGGVMFIEGVSDCFGLKLPMFMCIC